GCLLLGKTALLGVLGFGVLGFQFGELASLGRLFGLLLGHALRLGLLLCVLLAPLLDAAALCFLGLLGFGDALGLLSFLGVLRSLGFGRLLRLVRLLGFRRLLGLFRLQRLLGLLDLGLALGRLRPARLGQSALLLRLDGVRRL